MEKSRCLFWLFLREEGWNRGSLFALAPDTVQPVSGAFFYGFLYFTGGRKWLYTAGNCGQAGSGGDLPDGSEKVSLGRDSHMFLNETV